MLKDERVATVVGQRCCVGWRCQLGAQTGIPADGSGCRRPAPYLCAHYLHGGEE